MSKVLPDYLSEFATEKIKLGNQINFLSDSGGRL
jgi:hypothetical protein